MEGFRVSTSTLEDDQGNVIDNANITIRKVEYVRVRKPTDSYGFAGWWPDPLPLYEQSETLYPAENQAFWVTVKVPADAKAGDYSGNLRLSSGAWNFSVPVRLHVWNFTLPHTPSVRSGFGFSLGGVKNYDNLRTPEEEKEAFDYYMQAFRDYKISPYNPFQLSPIREEVTGVAWEGGYFDNQVKKEGNYAYRIEDNSFTYNAEGQAWILSRSTTTTRTRCVGAPARGKRNRTTSWAWSAMTRKRGSSSSRIVLKISRRGKSGSATSWTSAPSIMRSIL